ncbi:hypothetical protein C0J52_18630, partial [Blattella germanica]
VLWFHSSNVSLGSTSSELIKIWGKVLQIKSKATRLFIKTIKVHYRCIEINSTLET